MTKMSSKKKKTIDKYASGTARKMIKRLSEINRKSEVMLSLIILAIGVALGIVFDEFIMFLSIAVALDIVFIVVLNENK